jgi:hypothetical protein
MNIFNNVLVIEYIISHVVYIIKDILAQTFPLQINYMVTVIKMFNKCIRSHKNVLLPKSKKLYAKQ